VPENQKNQSNVSHRISNNQDALVHPRIGVHVHRYAWGRTVHGDGCNVKKRRGRCHSPFFSTIGSVKRHDSLERSRDATGLWLGDDSCVTATVIRLLSIRRLKSSAEHGGS
jgi:hypothetical protein